MTYLANLMLRLTAGAGRLPEQIRSRHAAYLRGEQLDDGSFAGRRGGGDLYYTSFALRGLAVLGELDDATASAAAGFLKSWIGRSVPSVDFLSLVTAAALIEMATGVEVFAAAGRNRRKTVIDFVEPFHRDDGGYAKTPGGALSSTYHTFLVAVCKQIVDAPLEETEQMIGFVRSRQRDDGGFVEIPPMRQGGTNPTAAAVGLLRLLDGLDEPTRAAAVEFLAGMQAADGGLRANSRVPVADLLSSFSGLVALGDLDADSAVDKAAALRLVNSLEQPGGGFRGVVFDDRADVEYTFYGLGTLALLAAEDA